MVKQRKRKGYENQTNHFLCNATMVTGFVYLIIVLECLSWMLCVKEFPLNYLMVLSITVLIINMECKGPSTKSISASKENFAHNYIAVDNNSDTWFPRRRRKQHDPLPCH